jgi:hypothetical protein
VVQGELFGFPQEQQLVLGLEGGGTLPREEVGASNGQEKETAMRASKDARSEADGQEMGRGSRRNYSSAQRVYWDQLEQGAYNAYAGGLLFAPLLARYHFVPTLRRVITIPTHEGYSLEELCLTLFYLDVFGFRSMEGLIRADEHRLNAEIARSQATPEADSSRIKPNQGASEKIEASAPQNPGQLPLNHQSSNPSIQSAADSSPIKPNQGPQEKLAAPQIAIQASNLLKAFQGRFFQGQSSQPSQQFFSRKVPHQPSPQSLSDILSRNAPMCDIPERSRPPNGPIKLPKLAVTKYPSCSIAFMNKQYPFAKSLGIIEHGACPLCR